MTDYTPTTEEIREAYAKRRALYLASSGHVLANDAKYNREDYAEFDRWMAAHDAEAREKGEPSDDGHLITDCEHGVNSLYDRCVPCEAAEQGEPSDAQEAEISARALDRVAVEFGETEGLGLTSDALWWWAWFAETLADKASMLRTEAAALRAAGGAR